MFDKVQRRSFVGSLAGIFAALWTASVSPSARVQNIPPQRETPGSAPPIDALYDSSLAATKLTGEAADRVAIRRLVDAWAHCADRRLAEQQANLFVPDGVVNNYEMTSTGMKLLSTLRGREELVKALAVLKKFNGTFHFNGQSEVAVSGDHAVGESYCMAHQLSDAGAKTKLEVLAIRYHDKFVREDQKWFFAERNLMIDWKDTRIS